MSYAVSLLGSVACLYGLLGFFRVQICSCFANLLYRDTCGSRLANACEKVPLSALTRSLCVRRLGVVLALVAATALFKPCLYFFM